MYQIIMYTWLLVAFLYTGYQRKNMSLMSVDELGRILFYFGLMIVSSVIEKTILFSLPIPYYGFFSTAYAFIIVFGGIIFTHKYFKVEEE